MASKIVLFVLVVTFYKVQTQAIYCANPQSSTASSNAKSSVAASPSSSNCQCSCNPSRTSQSQKFPSQQFNPNQGVKASSQLQLLPGLKCNLQAIPVSQVQGAVQQKGHKQNFGYSIPRPPSIQTFNPSIQTSPSPQVLTSPAHLIQPCLTGPASVITSPVSSITIPPSTTTTVFDHSLCNSLANALQMMIANEFINSAINNNIIKDGIQIPVVETVAPTFDLATFLKGLNTQQIQQGPSQCEAPPTDAPQYDWTAIKNFLNKQEEKPGCEATTAPTDVSNSMNYFQQYAPTANQISQQVNSQIYSPHPTGSQIPQAYPSHQSGDSGLETSAAHFGCNVSDNCFNTYTSVPQFSLPDEIPVQLICNYGYMPAAVPVVSISVQPVNGANDNNFTIGCNC